MPSFSIAVKRYLFIAAGLILLNFSSAQARSDLEYGEGLKKGEGSTAAAKEESFIERPKLEYKEEGLKDPFEPVIKEAEEVKPGTTEEAAVQLPSMTVQGLIWGGKFNQAIINNKVVKEGEILDNGVKIVKIERDGVLVIFSLKQFKLSAPVIPVSENKAQ